jgi:LuxR family transcriptional regulator, maltose regulon positive regulatory protein
LTVQILTKLNVPPRREGYVARKRLMRLMNRGLHTPLILLAAPAGSGKTTLVAEWCASYRTCWYSLDESDNDVVNFWSYLIAALDRWLPGTADQLLPMLDISPPSSIATAMINTLNTLSATLVLVLDDYHVIKEAAIHQAVTFLLEHCPPHLHIVITTRIDPPLPLSKLRARQHIIEIRGQDLRFTFEETAKFLLNTVPHSLTSEQIAILEQRTEGWITGLQLVSLTMNGDRDPAVFIPAFAGTHRYILDYLSEEVLHHQPAEVTAFLLQTCLLERFNAALCEAVTGSADAKDMLRTIEKAHLFVLPLDYEGEWYRYHFLFAEVLRQRLKQHPEYVPRELHRRAAHWFKANNYTEDALKHALHAEDFALMADLAEGSGDWLLLHLSTRAPLRWSAHLTPVRLHQHPRLAINFALSFVVLGKAANAELYLEAALKGIEQQDSETQHTLRGRADAVGAWIAFYQHKPDAAMQRAQRALETLAADDLHFGQLARMVKGLLLSSAHDLDGAFDTLSDGYKLAERAQELIAGVRFLTLLAEIEIARGHLREAIAICHHAIQFAESVGQGKSVNISVAYAYLGLFQLERGDIESAEHAVQQALERTQSMPMVYTLFALIVLARIRHVQKNETDALALLSQAESIRSAIGMMQQPDFFIHHTRSFLIGDVVENLHRLNQHESAFTPVHRARLLIAQGKMQEAATLIRALIESTTAQGQRIELLILLCRVNPPTDLTPIAEALTLAEREGYLRLFADEGTALIRPLRMALSHGIVPAYIIRILSAIGLNRAEPESGEQSYPNADLFTQREVEILRLLLDGLTNAEIAAQLVLSIGTVKKHLNNIFTKLDVSTRADAVDRARSLNVLR